MTEGGSNTPRSVQEERELLERAFGFHVRSDLANASALYLEIVRSNPRQFDALHLLGVVGTQQGDWVASRQWLEKALAECPDSVPALMNFAVLETAMGRHAAALERYEHLLSLEPRNAEALNGRGVALTSLRQVDAALGSFDDAISSNPSLALAHFNRGAILIERRKVAEARRDFENALAANPDLQQARIGLSLCCWQFCDWSDYDARRAEVLQAIRAGISAVPPFLFLTIGELAADQLLATKNYVRDNQKERDLTPAFRPDSRHDRVRLAYVSADFREHAVSYLIAGLIGQHDRARFEVFGFSTSLAGDDAMRQRLRGAFDQFIDVALQDDEAVARSIAGCGIDIAIDLTGLTENGRMGIFARRPAPIQVNFLGYPGTSGMPWMDYIIADAFVAPEHSEGWYSEKLVRLPRTFQVNDDQRPVPSRRLSRADAGLPEDAFIFASFNNNLKITPVVFECWMRLLRDVPGSLLWIYAPDPEVQKNLARTAGERGITRSRLIFAEPRPYPDHLARLALADLFLDTYPFNGGTTVSDAIWVGLPVVTCRGEAFCSRMAGSLLGAAGLSELVAETLPKYELVARTLATDAAAYARVSACLKDPQALPIFSLKDYCRGLEAAYRAMYDRHLYNLAPEAIRIEDEEETSSTKHPSTTKWWSRLVGRG